MTTTTETIWDIDTEFSSGAYSGRTLDEAIAVMAVEDGHVVGHGDLVAARPRTRVGTIDVTIAEDGTFSGDPLPEGCWAAYSADAEPDPAALVKGDSPSLADTVAEVRLLHEDDFPLTVTLEVWRPGKAVAGRVRIEIDPMPLETVLRQTSPDLYEEEVDPETGEIREMV